MLAGREIPPVQHCCACFEGYNQPRSLPEALPFSKISFPLGDGTRAASGKKRPLRSLDRCNQGKRPRSRRGSVGSQRTGYPTDARLTTRPAIHPQSKQERHEHDRDSHYPYCRAHCALSSSKLGKKGRYREEVRPLEEVQRSSISLTTAGDSRCGAIAIAAPPPPSRSRLQQYNPCKLNPARRSNNALNGAGRLFRSRGE